MKVTSIDQVQVGRWMTMCCEHSLYQITDDSLADDIEDVKTTLQDIAEGDCTFTYEIWDTKQDALLEIKQRCQ